MARYKVTIVAPGAAERPVLLVPFQPDALITAFIDEIFKRIARQNLSLRPDTHIATLHLDSETGATLDCEDLLSDVVGEDEREKLFMVLKEKQATSQDVADRADSRVSTEIKSPTQIPDGQVRIHVVTPARARQGVEQTNDHHITLPCTASIGQLHRDIALHLGVQAAVDEADLNECNCKLAGKLANDSQIPNQIFVTHGKSEIQRLNVNVPTETAIKQVLRSTFGNDLETRKKIVFVGGARDVSMPDLFSKMPALAVCSKHRHIPAHARTDNEEQTHSQSRAKVLDLHSTEAPIHPACADASLEDSGLLQLAQNGTVTIFAVLRSKSAVGSSTIGKNSIFRDKAHWEPKVKQSDRGIAMFLSSLRVAMSLIEGMRDDEKASDAVLHVLDLLTNFPPAVRTLYVLSQGKTPTPAECAAPSNSIFELLASFLPTSLLGTNQSRLFEGSRLLFGFILETAKSVRLPAEIAATPYLSAFDNVEIRDCKTFEPVLHAISTDKGILERNLFREFQANGLLQDSQLQDSLVEVASGNAQARLALLSGGQAGEVVAFSVERLHAAYTYNDNGSVDAAIDTNELSELDHLAELCGRNKLVVHRPSQLTSAVTPCLTFDRNAHLAVYTGEEGCGEPGRSSLLFRPQHGEAAVDTAVIEQLIAPIIRRYESDGTAVLDALGGAAVRRLQQPDEILMFCVDCSASMRTATDFDEVNEESDLLPSAESRARGLTAGEFYSRLSFDDLKERLCGCEGFMDMVAMVAEASNTNKRRAAESVLEILRAILSSQIIQKSKELDSLRARTHMWYGTRTQASEAERELNRLKEFWAALKTHEEATYDFLIYRALSNSRDITQRWYWSMNDPIPALQPAQQLPVLPSEITELPDNLRCPISHTLMEDAVHSSDGFTYARSALEQWYGIRKSSPMTGLPLSDTSLRLNNDVSDAAAAWIRGEDLMSKPESNAPRDDQQPEKKRHRSLDQIEITFDSRLGSFKRRVTPAMSLMDIYKLCFRGLRAKHSVFQLSSAQCGTLLPRASTAVSSTKIDNAQHITVRIADDEPTSARREGLASARSSTSDTCLVKVYGSADEMLFGFWTNKTKTTQTMTSVLWKYWRYMFSLSPLIPLISDKQVWTNMSNSGDGLMRGFPRESTERLTNFLNRNDCFGKLSPEKVYRDPDFYPGVSGPLVLKVEINRVSSREDEHGRLTRLDVLKQMFEAVINRTIAYNYKTHVGLITVGSKADVAMSISHVLENFRKRVNDMRAEGDTSLWDALALAKDQISEYAKKYPSAKKRIVCISDGKDTASVNNTARDMCWSLREAGIALDTVALGDEQNRDLRTISHLLGCYILEPKSLTNALAMCEMEPFLSLTDRPAIMPPPAVPGQKIQFLAHFWNARHHARSTKVNTDTVPPIKKHPNLDDDFIPLKAVTSRPLSSTSAGNSRGRLRTTRLMNEIKAIVADETKRKYDVYVSERDFSFWKIVMDGPDGSPYSAGTFVLYLSADEGYPTFAPKARFITKMHHPNINMNGRICHSIFDRDWTTDISMTSLLDTVYGLLYQPERSDPVNTTITLGFHHDEVEFAEEVRDHVQRHALKTREQWRAEILGEVSVEVEATEDEDDGDEDDSPSEDSELDSAFDEDD